MGSSLFVEFVETCRENGEGFVDYHWPKYGADTPQPKLSFVKLFEPWGWIVGTGIYLDDVDRAIASKEAEIMTAISSQRNVLILSIVALLALTAVVVVFISKQITRPIVTASEMLKDIAQGEGDLTRRLIVESSDEVGEMANWFNVFVEKIQRIIGSAVKCIEVS